MTAFTGLALLPDADVIMVALGTADAGWLGHRGASHSLPLAVLVGLLTAYVAQRFNWPVVRTAVMATAAVFSHTVLDLLGEGGRGLPALWPFAEMRFLSPVRIFPDAPRWPAMLSRPGLTSVAIEVVAFSPLALYALWPQLATSFVRLVRRRPAVEIGVAAQPAAVSVPAAAASLPPAPADTERVASTAEFGPPSDAATGSPTADQQSTDGDPHVRSVSGSSA